MISTLNNNIHIHNRCIGNVVETLCQQAKHHDKFSGVAITCVFIVKYASRNLASSVHCGTGGIFTAPLRIINAVIIICLEDHNSYRLYTFYS